MKKYLQNVWGRLLATLLCAIAVSLLAISTVCSVLYAELGDYQTAYYNGEQTVAENYGLYALDMVLDGNVGSLNQYLEQKQLHCVITKLPLESEESELLYTNAELESEWEFEFQVVEGAVFQYQTESVWGALNNSFYYQPDENWVRLEVIGHVYDAETGLFYYETEAGYFLIKNINIYFDDNTYIDYVYKIREGQPCYYNGYYNRVLEKADAQYWTHMETGYHRFKLWNYDTENDWNYVRYIASTEEIAADIKNIEYEIQARGSYIGCDYDGELGSYKIQLSRTGHVSNGMFDKWERMIDTLYLLENQVVTITIFSCLLLLVGTILLFYTAAAHADELGVLHKVPLGIYTFVIIIIEWLFVLLLKEPLVELIYYEDIQEIGYIFFGVVAFLAIWLVFAYLENVISRIRAKSLIRYSEIHYSIRIFKWIWEKVFGTITRPFRFILRMMRQNISLFWKVVMVFVVITLVEFFIMVINAYYFERLLVWFVLGKIIEVLLLFFVLVQMHRLQEGAKRIASGDLSVPIDTSKMCWEFKKHGDYINNVGESIHLAVQEQMKSERFKTELITNVSHDIKTPLTSIINYVDLIKKEEIADEKLNEYVEVLDRQSARLKKLIEDLMEASKASTGNLTVQLEEFDVEVLLTQVIGEFEDRLAKSELQMMVDKPEHSVYVLADGRHMWRVLDNILGNACKYALPNTRVYVSLKQERDEAVIVFKNISKAALNIPSEELMERFVRGDSSRNTEGSGLGLSIAQSLTELMKGTMKLDIDGDLFKVTLRFPVVRSGNVF